MLGVKHRAKSTAFTVGPCWKKPSFHGRTPALEMGWATDPPAAPGSRSHAGYGGSPGSSLRLVTQHKPPSLNFSTFKNQLPHLQS